MASILTTEYNSQKSNLTISEYGRNVQDLIAYAKTIENDEERQRTAEAIIEIMRIVNPQKSAFEDVTLKLWKHFFRIANYDIEVTPPVGEKPTKLSLEKQDDTLNYPVQEVRFRHYGHNIQVLVRKAVDMEEGETKNELVKIIGSYMKLAYKTWNREHYVSDELIKGDLENLSGHKLSLDDDVQFDTALAPVVHQNPNAKKSSYGRGGSKYGNRSNNTRSGGRRSSNTNSGGYSKNRRRN
jgi:hypothetical protein